MWPHMPITMLGTQEEITKIVPNLEQLDLYYQEVIDNMKQQQKCKSPHKKITIEIM